jgi:hypothetical protein
VRRPPGRSLPTGVHAIVAARLDALPATDKAVARRRRRAGPGRLAGALGRGRGRSCRELEACLARLEAREFVQRAARLQGGRRGRVRFRHALVRDVAYGQVLRAERADKHRRAAGWIERLAPDRAEGRAELLAYHYRAAAVVRPGRRDRAARAGRPARLGALREAGDRAAALGGCETAARSSRRRWSSARTATRPRAAAAAPRPGPLPGRDGRPRRPRRARRGLLLAGEPVAAAEAEMLLGELAFLQGRGEDGRPPT